MNVVENFDQIMEDFRETEPQLVLLDINLLHSMDFIGAKKCAKNLMFLSCLLVRERIIWIKLWLFKWVAMTLLRNHSIYR